MQTELFGMPTIFYREREREKYYVGERETMRVGVIEFYLVVFAPTSPPPSPPLRPHETLVICRAINYAQVLIIFPFSILPFCFYPNYIFRPVATLPWLLSKANVGRRTVHSSPLRLAPMIISSAKHISVSGYNIYILGAEWGFLECKA